LRSLTDRFDPEAFELGRRKARIRLSGIGSKSYDVVLDGSGSGSRSGPGSVASVGPARERERPDAVLTADLETWTAIASDVRGGMDAFRKGRLRIRHDLHLGVGFLAATADSGDEGLRFRQVQTRCGAVSVAVAGTGPTVLMIHGLGATKVSFLPTVAALASRFRAIAVDLPGFGDSDKPLMARYDAPFFASWMVALLDALEVHEAFVVGNSMGGRVAIELGLSAPERVDRLALLAPSLAWLRPRPWAPFLSLVMPQLGVIQPAPRPIVERIVRRAVPGASEEEWTAAGVDEFLRSYLTPRGRAAFYTAARSIYLEKPHGRSGFWTRLGGLEVPSLFVWGRADTLVPISFERHVQEVLPSASHLELSCGHVPQLERPKETHEAIEQFFLEGRQCRRRGGERPAVTA
jgi:pimeloyl-ACP methyl ester carboxylesterase